MFLCLFNREHNLVHRFGESLVCNAGIGVLLMNGCFYAKLTGRSDNGTADISAEAYNNVRFKFFDYFLTSLDELIIRKRVLMFLAIFLAENFLWNPVISMVLKAKSAAGTSFDSICSFVPIKVCRHPDGGV